MRARAVIVVAVAALVGTVGLRAPGGWAEASRPVLAVLDFGVSDVSASEMSAIVELMTSALFKLDRFDVIDAAQRQTLLKELSFSLSDCSDESCQLEVGKMLSAELIVVGRVSRVGSKYILTAKILETETAKTRSTADGVYASMDGLIGGLNFFVPQLAKPFAAARRPAAAAAAARTIKPIRWGAWASLAGGVACLGAGGYLLAVAVPPTVEYLNSRSAYARAATGADFDTLYATMEAARERAVVSGANVKLPVGATFAGVGLGLGGLSVVLFALKPARGVSVSFDGRSLTLSLGL